MRRQKILKTEEDREELLTRRLSALVYNNLSRPTELKMVGGEGRMWGKEEKGTIKGTGIPQKRGGQVNESGA